MTVILFSGHPGRVVAMEDPAVQGFFQLLSLNPPVSYETHRALITRAQLSQRVNLQAAHMIGSDIDIYVFGDQIGSMSLQGVALTDCDTGRHGIDAILAYYRLNRLTVRGQPMNIILGSTPFEGLLVGMDTDVADADKRIVVFTMTLIIFPEFDLAPVNPGNANGGGLGGSGSGGGGTGGGGSGGTGGGGTGGGDGNRGRLDAASTVSEDQIFLLGGTGV